MAQQVGILCVFFRSLSVEPSTSNLNYEIGIALARAMLLMAENHRICFVKKQSL